MVITITVNPSIDRLYHVSKLISGELNRVNLISKMVGGKGINAARVSAILGANTLVTGILGGQNGSYANEMLKKEKFISDFIITETETRSCFTIIDDSNKKTEINELGEPANNHQLCLLLEKIKNKVLYDSVSAISINGSLSPKMPSDFYVKLIKNIRNLNSSIPIILDTSGIALSEVIKSTVIPNFIKPNEYEIAELLNSPVTKDVDFLISKIRQNSTLMKIPNIFVSLGSHGSLVKHNQHFFKVSIPKVTAVNTEGSGDASVGGILAAIEKNKSFKTIMEYAVAAGTANALESNTGFIKKDVFKQILKEVHIQEKSDENILQVEY